MSTIARTLALDFALAQPDQGRSLRPDEAPVLASQVDPAQMPRMCAGLARVRLALYAASQHMVIIKAPTGWQVDEMQREHASAAYQKALTNYKTHVAICPECRVMLGYPADVDIQIEIE